MLHLNFIQDIFTKLDGYVQGFMSVILDGFNGFWTDFYNRAGTGAYFCAILVGLFFLVLFIIGLVNFCKKFGWFLVFLILTIGIPVLWFFVCK